MSISDDIREARRLWAEAKAIEAARLRAPTAQVRGEMMRMEHDAWARIDGDYNMGRVEGARVTDVRHLPESLPDLFEKTYAYRAGFADGLLDSIGVTP